MTKPGAFTIIWNGKIEEKDGQSMINKLVEKIKKTNAPIVVGLDPMMKFIP